MAFPLWSCHVIQMCFNDRFLNVSESIEMKPENKHYKTLHGVRSRILCSQGLRVIACTNSSTEEIGLKNLKSGRSGWNGSNVITSQQASTKKMTSSKLIRWSTQWVEMRTRS